MYIVVLFIVCIISLFYKTVVKFIRLFYAHTMYIFLKSRKIHNHKKVIKVNVVWKK